MPDLGDLEHLLRDESENDSLVDLDWLDVDEEDYRRMEETLPEQNLDAIPDLKEEWGRRQKEDEQYNLSPVNQRPDQKSPFWSEDRSETGSGLTDREKAIIVDRFLKRKLIQGYDQDDALEVLNQEFDDRTIESAKHSIKETIQEDGLLGTVYIDSSLFPDCDEGQGQDFVQKHASKADYVIGKDDCHDCIYNEGGVCSRFEKEIVFDLEYNEELWEDYRDKFETEDRDLSHIDPSDDPKSKIRQASKAEPKDRSGSFDRKPVRPSHDITEEEARDVVSNTETKREIVGDVYQERKERDVALEMMKEGSDAQPHSEPLLDRLRHDPDLERLSKSAHLLGPLYLDLSYFDTRKEASDFFDKHDIPTDNRVMVGSPRDESSDGRDHPLRNKEAINRILRRYALTEYGPDFQDKTATLENIGKRLLQSDSGRLRAFARNVFSKPLPQNTRSYDITGQPIYDPTEDITEEEARRTLKEMSRDRESVDHNPSIINRRNKIAQMMMASDFHDDRILDMIEASDDEAVLELKKHAHLLGSLYIDSSYFKSDREKRAFFDDHPELNDLPDLDGEDVRSFLSYDDVKSRISSRLDQFDPSDLPDRDDLLSDGMYSLAKTIFSGLPPSGKRSYDTTGQPIYDPTEGITRDEAIEHLQSLASERDSVETPSHAVEMRNEIAKRMMASDFHDESITSLIQASDDDAVASLQKHLHLLGSLYKDSSYFDSDREYRAFLDDHPDLEDLPDLDGDELASFLKRDDIQDRLTSRLSEFDQSNLDKEALSSRGLHGFAQELYRRSPRTTRTYDGQMSTSQTRARIESRDGTLTEREASDILADLDDGDRHHDAFHLPSFLRRSDHAREVIGAITSTIGSDALKTLYIHNDSITASDISDHRDHVRSVMSSVYGDQFDYRGLTYLPDHDFEMSKVASHLRDIMMEGKHQESLVDDLKQTFSNQTLLREAPVVASFRQEEGLYGRTYITANTYQDCVEGDRSVPDTVSQVIKSNKCEDCIYNRGDTCGLYQLDLVDQPRYNTETVQSALKNRLMNGRLNRRQAETILDSNLDPKEKTRIAHIGDPDVDKSASIVAPFSGHYLSEKDPSVTDKDVEYMVRFAREKAESGKYDRYHLKKMIRDRFPPKAIIEGSDELKEVFASMDPSEVPTTIDYDSTEAPSGETMLDEFEMHSSNDPTEHIDMSGSDDDQQDQEDVDGIEFGGFRFDI